MTEKNSLLTPLLLFVLVFFISNCSTSESVISGTQVKSNQGIITISELSTENSSVAKAATFKPGADSLFIEYPKMCWDYKNEGKVQLFMDINEQGKSTNTKVTRGIGMGCDIAAHTAMKNATYSPALDAYGNPLAAIHNVTVIFERYP